MTTFAYIRVSTDSQTTDNQRVRIADAGFAIDQWFDDSAVSGSKSAFERENFKALLSIIKENDTIIVTEISRIGRSTTDVLEVIKALTTKGVKLRIVNLDGIDLTSPMGKLIVTVMASCAQFEKDLLIERVVAGLNRTKAEGTILGKPPKTTPEQLKSIVREIWSGKALNELAEAYSVSTRTLGRYKKQYTTETSLKEYEEVYFKRLQQIAGNV